MQGRRLPGFAQIADHLTHNSPFLPFFGEVVCTLGGTLPYESHSCRRCADSTFLMPPRPPNRPDTGYHRARECSSSAQRRPGPKLMLRGHSANNERSARPRVGLTSSDTTRQHHVSNSPFSMPTRGRSAGNRSLIFLEMPPPLMWGCAHWAGGGDVNREV